MLVTQINNCRKIWKPEREKYERTVTIAILKIPLLAENTTDFRVHLHKSH